MPCSPAQHEANRKNAQRSCGPRTAEGKARSRGNALKHGLAGAGVVLPESAAQAVGDRFDEMGAVRLVRPALARRVAVLTERLDRLAEHDEAATARRVREAGAGVAETRHRAVDDLVERLTAEPVAASRQLRATPEGCDRLLTLWEDLARCVAAGLPWGERFRKRAEALAGHDPSLFAPSDWDLYQYGWETPLPATADDPTGGEPGRVAAAHASLRRQITARIDGEIRSLRGHRLALTGDLDQDARLAEAQALALFDDSPQAALLRRYEMATERGLYRALRELERPMPPPEPPATEEPPIPPETSADEEDTAELGSFGGAATATDPAPSDPRSDRSPRVAPDSPRLEGRVVPGGE